MKYIVSENKIQRILNQEKGSTTFYRRTFLRDFRNYESAVEYARRAAKSDAAIYVEVERESGDSRNIEERCILSIVNGKETHLM